ncbi:MAG: exosortase K [Lachnospiraceae bacterium]|nr:exosortase K [Lachnospiraceae bacterium]
MNKLELKTRLQNNWIFYLLTVLAALAMRYFSRITDSDALTWILKPTARWAGILGGIPFEYLPHIGYVNHTYRFIIAPSCAGIRFLMIAFLMLAFSYVHQFPSRLLKSLWFTGSAVFSYLFTILVNGIRIVAAIYLPIPFEQAGLLNGWLNPDRLHTLIGTAVYFSALCAVYPAVSYVCRCLLMQLSVPCADNLSANVSGDEAPSPSLEPKSRLLAPAFWYLLAVLAVPFAGRIVRNDWKGFGSYALLITGACLVILSVSCLVHKVLRFRA